MQPEHVAFGVHREDDEPVLSNGHLLAVNLAARGGDARPLDCAILAAEVDQRTVPPDGTPGTLTSAPELPGWPIACGKAHISMAGLLSRCSFAANTVS